MTMLWTTHENEHTLGAVGAEGFNTIVDNTLSDPGEIGHKLTVVDGLLTVFCEGTNLYGIRLIVAQKDVATTELDYTTLLRRDERVYYLWHVAGGPSYFRLRSKKTILPDHILHCHVYKAVSTTSNTVRYGLQIATVAST